jgi:Putative auto-transporter adhesin, head GIN domain
MKRSIYYILPVLIALGLTSCIYVNTKENDQGFNPNSIFGGPNCDSPNQAIITKDKPITDKIEGIRIQSGLSLVTKQGTSSNLLMSGGTQDLEKLDIQNQDGLLTIKLKNFSCVTTPIEITLNVKDNFLINNLDASGASNIVIAENIVSKEKLNIDLSGTSKISIAASAGIKSITIDESGSSKIDISTQNIDTINIDASGASNAVIQSNTTNRGNFQASGASRISVGQIKDARVDASGASTIQLIDSQINSSETSGASRIVNEKY